MSVYTVYEPPEDQRAKLERADDLVFVHDDLARSTLIFGPLSLLFKQQWVSLVGYVILAALFAGFFSLAGLPAVVWGYFYLALNLIFALEESLIRGAVLEARGWSPVGVTEGRTKEDAEYRFIASWLGSHGNDKSKDQSEAKTQITLQGSASGVISPALKEARRPRILN